MEPFLIAGSPRDCNLSWTLHSCVQIATNDLALDMVYWAVRYKNDKEPSAKPGSVSDLAASREWIKRSGS